MKVCSVCGSALEGDGTMNRQQYTHPPGAVSACLNGEWKPITPQQLADELTALRACVKAADAYVDAVVRIEGSPAMMKVYGIAEAHGCPYSGPNWSGELAAYRAARAEVDK